MPRKFEEIINELKNLPIYTMSLGSKELFHSNFWAWLMEQDETKALVKLFFDEIDITKEIKIEREKNNRDITIWDNSGNAYVIENKIKSFPDEDQLKRYEKNTKKFVRGIITGIKEPPFNLVGTKWTFISYEKIAKYLERLSKNVTEPNLKNALEQYCIMIRDINDIINQCLDSTKDFYEPYPNNKYTLLKDQNIRLHDVYHKIKADEFFKAVFMRIKNEFKSEKFCIEIGRGYHNVKPTLDMSIIAKDCKDERKWDKRLMLQIEGYQFRIFYRWSNQKEEKIFENGKQFGWFDKDFNKKTNRKIRKYVTSMKNDHCQYSGVNIYQYFDLWNKKANQDLLSYDKIYELLSKEVKKAKKIVESHEKEFIPPFVVK